MVNIYYKIDGDYIYYCNTQKPGYLTGTSEIGGSNKIIILELTDDKFILPTQDSTCNKSGFQYCKNTEIDNLDKIVFEPGYEVNLSRAFGESGGLTRVDLSNGNIENLRDASSMFTRCYSLEYVKFFPQSSNNNTCEKFDSMFHDCRNLSFLDLRGYNMPLTPYEADEVFYYCQNLSYIAVDPGTDGAKTGCTSSYRMFYNCSNLPNGDGVMSVNRANDHGGYFKTYHEGNSYKVYLKV